MGASLLKEWRTAKGWRLEDAARLFESSAPNLSRIEQGKSRPGRGLAMRIHKFTDGAVPFTSWE